MSSEFSSVRKLKKVSAHPLGVSGCEVVFLRAYIAQERRSGKIGLGETHVSFIRILIGIARFEFKRVVSPFGFSGIHFEFSDPIVAFETCILFVFKMFEAIGLVAEVFHHIAKVFFAIACVDVRFKGVVSSTGST